MAVICPAVLAKDPHEYREQMERVGNFTGRIHIDLTDGQFAPSQTIGIENIWWPENIQIDLHLMHKRPADILNKAIELKPNLIIVHAEADGDFEAISKQLRGAGIKAGVALLKGTPVSLLKGSEHLIDYVLIFGGDLGHFGGRANLSLLGKVGEVKALNSNIEVGWDGGVNAENAKTMVHNDVDVLNVGGFIQNSPSPQEAYATLEAAIKEG